MRESRTWQAFRVSATPLAKPGHTSDTGVVVAAVWVRVQLLETEKKATLRETYDFWKGPEAAAVLHRCAPARTPAANTRIHASGEHTPAANTRQRRIHASGAYTDPGSCALALRRAPLAVRVNSRVPRSQQNSKPWP